MLRVKRRKFVEQLRVMRRYYGNLSFLKTDIHLGLHYLFRSPYRVSKEYLQLAGASDVHTYGETPLTTLEQIASQCDICPDQTVYELGCGTGRTCLWLHAFTGAKVIGIDHNPAFIRNAKRAIPDVEFRRADIFTQDYADADLVYLYGSCMSDEEAKKIARALQRAKRVVSVSFPLDGFATEKRFTARFTWGEADVFLQRRG